ncbi:MAG: lytic transglycosylase domain-containing protein [Proteobacteria bacterium]|nr:lytic transglycosylase domain-containing protein [Pseudomonadota bacterium]
MKYLRPRPIGVFKCLLIAGLIVPFGNAQAGSGQSFKRIKVGTQALGARINVQIKPEESYYHQKPSTSTSLSTRAPLPSEAIKAAPKPPGQFEWFWSDFAHDISSASLTRLNDAELQLAKAPRKHSNIAPTLAAMRKLVSAYGTEILMATLDKDVSPALVLAVIGVESSGRADVVSSAGAVGLMQLIPETAKRFNVTDITDPKQNIAGGVAYLDWLIKEFNNDAVLALAGYNAGENAVKKYDGVPPYAETRAYIPKVIAAWKVAKALCQTPPKYAIDGCVFDLNPKVAQQ